MYYLIRWSLIFCIIIQCYFFGCQSSALSDGNSTFANTTLESQATSNTVILSWVQYKDEDNVTNIYNVFVDGFFVNSTNQTIYEVANLTARTSYEFKVCIKNVTVLNVTCIYIVETTLDANITSNRTCISNVTLKAIALSSSEIQLSWNSSNTTYGDELYTLYVNDILETRINNTIYVKTELFANTSYEFKVCQDNGSCLCATSKTFASEVVPEKLCNILNETLNATTFPSSIILQWNNISSLLKQPYSIYVDDLFVASEDNTSYTLTNLNANTTYEIKICSQNISCICTTRTTDKIDVVPPVKLTCNIPNETLNATTFPSSIILQWNNISSLLKQPYSIYVDDLFVASEDNTSYTLTNLNANTTYEIKICLQNISCICTTRTTDKIDGRIILMDFAILNITSTSVNFTWSLLNYFNVSVTYNMTYNKINATKQPLVEVFMGKNVTQYAIYGLEEFVTYQFVLTASSDEYGNSSSSSLNVTTLPSEPSGMPSNFTAITNSSTSIYLQWLPVESVDLNGILNYYIIYFNSSIYASSINIVGNDILIINLNASTTYDFKVAAVNQIGEGPVAMAKETTENEDLESVYNITTNNLTSTSVYVSWQINNPLNVNISFQITYRELSAPTTSSHSRFIMNSFVNLTGLEEFVVYVMTIQPMEPTLGNGTLSDFNFTTLPALPSGKPVNISVMVVSSTSISLSWQPLIYYDRNGDIKQYIIKYNSTNEDNDTVMTNQTNYWLMNLTKFEKYDFKIQAENQIGVGPYAYTSATTFEDSPTPPENLTVADYTSTSINITWLIPKYSNGILLGYKIKICNGNQIQCPQVNQTERSYKYIDLEPYTNYTIYVVAYTVIGDSNQAKLTVLTKESVPSKPLEVEANATYNSISIQWNKPQHLNGLLRGYIISICEIDKSNNKSCLQNITALSTELSKTISNLTAYTQYEISIQAFNGAGQSPPFTFTKRTLEHIPGTVENLQVSSFTPTSINLTWTKPNITNGQVFYIISYKEESANTYTELGETNATHVKIAELQEYFCYDIKVQTFTKQGGNGESQFIKQRTAPTVPGGAPIGFLATAVTSTSINLTWQPVLDILQNGRIENYIINYTTKEDVISISTNETQYLIEDLEKYTFYGFNVSAKNQVGIGGFAYVNTTTLEDTPGAPLKFTCQSKSSTEIALKWLQPNVTNGIIVGYQLKKINKMVNINLTSLNYQDIELAPFTSYTYGLQAQTKIGFGPNRTVTCQTNETIPNPPEELMVVNQAAFWFIISWKEPSEKLGRINGYEVTVSNASVKLLDKKFTNSMSLNVSKGVMSFTVYNVDVAAKTSIGAGEVSSVELMTNESIPSPIETFKPLIESTSIKLAWSRPKYPNGILRYKVLIKAQNEDEKQLEEATSAEEYEFKDLQEFQNYTFTIIPYTMGGGAAPRQSITLTTDSAAPDGMVTDLSSVALNSTAVRLTWQAVEVAARNGIIDYYAIVYKQDGVTKSKLVDVNDQNDEVSLIVSPLNSYVNYTFNVTAHNEKGDGPIAVTIVTTKQDAPGAPRLSTVAKNITARKIKISWLPPLQINGKLTAYFLRYSIASSSISQIENRVYSYDKLSAELDNLEPYTLYKVSLRAKTIKEGPEDIRYYLTNSTDPVGPPMEVAKVARNSTSITIAWSPPEKPNGKLVSYTVSCKKNDRIVDEITTHSTRYDFINLLPFTYYVFSVQFNGEYGFKSPYSADVAVRTDSAKPPQPPPVTPPPDVIKSYKEIVIPLWIAKDTNGPIRYYYILVIEAISDGHEHKPVKQPNDYKTSDFLTYDEYMESDEKKDRPYIAAVIQQSDITNYYGVFTIGDGKKSTAVKYRRRRQTGHQKIYVNGPLDENKNYYVFQRAYVEEDKFVSSSSWVGPFETIGKPVVPEEGGNGGVIAGVVVVLVLIIAVVLAALYFFKYRRTPTGGDKFNKDRSRTNSGIGNTAFVSDDDGHHPASGPIKVEDFSAYVRNLSRDGKYLFSEEFKLIQTGRSGYNCMYEHSNHPINREKNRYNNIVAYDHTRVLLQPIEGVPESDYINANYIDGFNRQAAYIATQGPLEGTFEDFWRMCWEQSVNSIVMLTRLEESGRIKCHQYWPEVGSICYGEMQVTLTESNYFPSYIKRTFSLLNEGYPGSERFISHYSLLTWNDHSTANSQECLTFIRRVNQGTPLSGGPIVVHCSAGVGRTGTYIVLDVNLRRIETEGKIEIFNYLTHIRSQRNYMVQTEAQYVFIHDTLLEYLTFGVTEVQVRNLRDYIKRLQQPTDTGSAEMNVDKEFHKLNLFDQSSSKTMHAANASCNKNKNRFLNVLPYDDTRVALRQLPGIQGSDYINANYIHGYSHAKQFIATQAPLPQTIPAFWRMIWEHHCMTIVCLAQESEGGKVKIHRYWPSIEASIHGPLMVEMVTEDTHGDFIVREFKVTHTTEGHSRTIKHFQYINWPDNSYPQSAAGLVDLIGRVQKWHQQNSVGQIVVHCSAGVGRTGVLIALCNMIERVRVEGVVDIFQTVRELRTQRPAMVQTKAQYLFCYLALQDFLASFDIYQNFL